MSSDFSSGLGSILKKFAKSEEIFRVSLIYLMYGQTAVCKKSICLHLENSIAFQTVIQGLRTVCDDRNRSAPVDEMSHSKSYTVAA